MAGLGRIQQRFNLAVVGALAALVGFARGGSKQEATRLDGTTGHPILAKALKSSNPNGNNRGYEYPGFCAGAKETERRRRQLERWGKHIVQEDRP